MLTIIWCDVLWFQRNEEYRAKLDEDGKQRATEWKEKKRDYKQFLKSKYKEELRQWLQSEKETKIKEDKKRRKKEYLALR